MDSHRTDKKILYCFNDLRKEMLGLFSWHLVSVSLQYLCLNVYFFFEPIKYEGMDYGVYK